MVGGPENRDETGGAGGSPDNNPKEPRNAAVQLMVFVLGFIAFLTFLFYVMGLYDVK
ncbi:MAG TPA: hypothetical protein VLB09_01630 [Nitrospiria bacterium]|nr:hypothetical protein [Nitrospiria bacterium]